MGTAKVILADAMPKTPAIPRSTDGMAGIRSPPRPLTEQAISPIMDVGAVLSCGDGAGRRERLRGGGGLETCMGTLGLRIVHGCTSGVDGGVCACVTAER